MHRYPYARHDGCGEWFGPALFAASEESGNAARTRVAWSEYAYCALLLARCGVGPVVSESLGAGGLHDANCIASFLI